MKQLALNNQLTTLVNHVRKLCQRLQNVDYKVCKEALNVCRLRRRKQNLSIVVEKLVLMHSLHQTQPTIQSLLSGNEFSGKISGKICKNYQNLEVQVRNISASVT